jgi:hypothetical protein
VVHDKVGNDPDAALVRLLDQLDEVGDVAVLGKNPQIVSDVVAAVTERRLVDRQQPDAVDPQPLEVVKPRRQPLDVAGAVTIGVLEAPDEHFVEHRPLVPLGVPGTVKGEVRYPFTRRRGKRRCRDRFW